MSLALYDAHNHLQDERLAPQGDAIAEAAFSAGVTRMVVNGTCESDWLAVLELARRHPQVIPSFGYHPWHVQQRTPDWQRALNKLLDEMPSAIGEIGLDRWVKNHNPAEQETVFIWQLRFAAERNRPASIHCLQAWGRLLEILRAEPRPACGFLLHSYGGSTEMIQPLAELGAYFSLPGYYAHARKTKQREAFRHVPPDRLLLETDAPDQLLPDALNVYPLTDGRTVKPVNHPANLGTVYRFAAGLFEQPLSVLAARVEENFQRLFAFAF